MGGVALTAAKAGSDVGGVGAVDKGDTLEPGEKGIVGCTVDGIGDRRAGSA